MDKITVGGGKDMGTQWVSKDETEREGEKIMFMIKVETRDEA